MSLMSEYIQRYLGMDAAGIHCPSLMQVLEKRTQLSSNCFQTVREGKKIGLT